MQFGQLVTRSFSILLRHPYLWLLAILGGADVGAWGYIGPAHSASMSGTPSEPGRLTLGELAPQVPHYVQDHLRVSAALLGILLLVGTVWLLLSCIATGALVRASAEHDAERPFRLRLAWRAGLRAFTSVIGLRLLRLMWFLGVLALSGGLVLLGHLGSTVPQTKIVAASIALGVLAVLVLLVLSVPVRIAIILGTRSVVLEQCDAIAALRDAVRIMRAQFGGVLFLWVLQIGLGLLAALILAIPVVTLLLLVSAILYVFLLVAPNPTAAIALVLGVGVAFLINVVVVAAMIGTYLSTYWTLAFRRMELGMSRGVAPERPTA